MKEFQDKRPISLTLDIEGTKYEWHDQYITGSQVKNLGHIPVNEDLYLTIEGPWEDELIEDNTLVNLGRPGIESFKIRHKLIFVINGKSYEWYKQFISGSELRRLGNIDDAENLYLSLKEPLDDEFILNDTNVDLARSGIEHFLSKRPSEVSIIVQGKPYVWNKSSITYEEVVHLVFPNVDYVNKVYTVLYSNGPRSNPSGSLELGDNVYVKQNMIFNVTPTNRS